jgi:putative intracellular protease/amidase
MGLKVTPDYGFADTPAVDVLLVPGGDVHAMRASEEALSWVRRTADEADYVLSVCNGAFILAEAGLLEGRQATTFYRMLDELQESFPGTEVVRDRRYTDNGKVLTSAGLSSGIDASLHLASRILGEDRARTLALHLEYDWDPEAAFARGALADRHLPSIDLDLPPGVSLQRLTSLGDRDSWEIRWSADPDVEPSVLIDAFARALEGREGWLAGARTAKTMVWRLSTRDDGDWVASLVVARSGDDALVTANLARVEEVDD